MTWATRLARRARAALSGGSLRRQLVLLTGAVSVAAVVLLGALVQLVLAHTTSTAVTRVLDDRAAAVVAAADDVSTATELRVPDSQLEAGVAVYDGSGDVVAGAVPDRLREQYADLGRVDSAVSVVLGDYARLRAAPFTTPTGLRGTVVVSERLEPYTTAEHYALVVTAGAGVLLVAASVGLVAWVSERALAPVAEMAATAQDWSEHDLSRRFALGPPTNEINRLGRTLDGLLDKVSLAIRSEQRLTSELAHELRTPLTAVSAGAEMLLLHEDLPDPAREEVEEVLAGCRRMAETITGLLDLARNESSMAASSTCSVGEVVAEVLAGSGAGADPRPEVVCHVAPDARWAVPAALAVRALAPLVSNATRMARTRVRLSTRQEPGELLSVLVEDDGPGVDAARREAIFRPGETSGSGAGLGLALSRRIARTSGGDAALEPAPDLTRFVLRLPASRSR